MGEFERDIAAADNDDAFGKGPELERLIGGDAEIAAVRMGVARRMAARGDQDRIGGDVAGGAYEMNRVLVFLHRAVFADHTARAVDRVTVKGLPPHHLPPL